MIRAVWQIAVAGWISAALTVSPMLAAMQCQACCDVASPTCVVASVSPCCAAHAQSQSDEPQKQCPNCPKCNSQRPQPAVAVSLGEWKPPVVAIAGSWTAEIDTHAALALALDTSRTHVDRALPPPPRVLFCTWQE